MNGAVYTIQRVRTEQLLLWGIGAALLLSAVAYQTSASVYDGLDEGLGWLVPNILPTLSLIVGVVMSEAVRQRGEVSNDTREVTSLGRGLLFAAAVAYLSALFVVIACAGRSDAPGKFLRDSNLVIGPLQGFAVATIGVIFARSSGESNKQAAGE